MHQHVIIVAAVALTGMLNRAAAEPAPDFYRGKTISILIGRLLAAASISPRGWWRAISDARPLVLSLQRARTRDFMPGLK